MKSVMILAAVAAVAGSAVASTCTITPTSTSTVQRAAVYQWKFTGKTTVGYIVKDVEKISVGGSNCQLGTTSNKVTQCAIRIPGALAIQGYTYVCDACCGSYKDMLENFASPSVFYMTKPFKTVLTPEFTIQCDHVIGKKGTQCEGGGSVLFATAEPAELYDLTFSGLGTYSKAYELPMSVSGNFAGFVQSPYYVSKGVCLPADWFKCDGATFAGAPDEVSVAYGKWTVKYSSSASKKYLNKGTQVKVPSWVK